MRMFVTFAVLVLALPVVASAKLRVKIGVSVSEDEKMSSELQEGMEARINSTERYVLTGVADADLPVSVDCLVLENESNHKTGVVCHSDVTYYPFEGSALSTPILVANYMVVSGHDTTYIVEKIMTHFINGTADDILSARKQILEKPMRRPACRM